MLYVQIFYVDLEVKHCYTKLFCQLIIKQIWAVSVEYNRVLQAEKNDTLIIEICSEIRKLYHFLIIFKPGRFGDDVIAAPLSPPHFCPIANMCRRFFPSGGGIAVPFQLLVTTLQ